MRRRDGPARSSCPCPLPARRRFRRRRVGSSPCWQAGRDRSVSRARAWLSWGPVRNGASPGAPSGRSMSSPTRTGARRFGPRGSPWPTARWSPCQTATVSWPGPSRVGGATRGGRGSAAACRRPGPFALKETSARFEARAKSRVPKHEAFQRMQPPERRPAGRRAERRLGFLALRSWAPLPRKGHRAKDRSAGTSRRARPGNPGGSPRGAPRGPAGARVSGAVGKKRTRRRATGTAPIAWPNDLRCLQDFRRLVKNKRERSRSPIRTSRRSGRLSGLSRPRSPRAPRGRGAPCLPPRRRRPHPCTDTRSPSRPIAAECGPKGRAGSPD